MRRLLTAVLSFLLLVSCGKENGLHTSEDVPESAETAAQTEMTEADISGISETEPETAETIPETEESEEITIVFGDSSAETAETQLPETEPAETNSTGSEPEDTGDGIIRMLVPTEYSQVRDALTRSKWYGMAYEKAVEWDIPATMAEIAEPEEAVPVPESVMDEPDFGTSFAPADEAPGKVYTAEEAYSKTNTQLVGIDEGDIVKTDGEFIYVLKDMTELVILSADGADTAVLSRTKLTENAEYCGVAPVGGGKSRSVSVEQTAQELYLHGDRAAVIYSENKWTNGTLERKTCADLYDVSDPSEPIYVTTLGQDGYYSTSRMIDGILWLITSYTLSIEDIAEPMDTESYIPGLFVKESQTLIDPGRIVYPEELESQTYTVITAMDVKSGSRQDSKAVLGIRADILYMNSASVYLADQIYYNEESEPRTEGIYKVVDHKNGTRTKLMRLDITDGIRTAAYTELPGAMLNQFSMDEYNGHLRVVVTVNERSHTTFTDESWGFVNTRYNPDNRSNALYILDRDLNITGKIEDLAPDESVKSVRFTGNTGYFVTFRQVDPLFTVDLTDPSEPVIMSELKIPGFSQYLHPWGNGLLLGLGQDADVNTGWTTGLKLSMFNTGNPHDVTEQHKLKLDYGWSAALYNHKAILVSESRNLIGFPADNGYAVCGYDPDSGFYQKAFIEGVNGWDGLTRGLFVGDEVYIVMQKGCTVLDMNDFSVLAAVGY